AHGVAFGWEEKPGIPKWLSFSKTLEKAPEPLKLPPRLYFPRRDDGADSATSTSQSPRHHGSKMFRSRPNQGRKELDPFTIAMMEATRDVPGSDDTHASSSKKWPWKKILSLGILSNKKERADSTKTDAVFGSTQSHDSAHGIESTTEGKAQEELTRANSIVLRQGQLSCIPFGRGGRRQRRRQGRQGWSGDGGGQRVKGGREEEAAQRAPSWEILVLAMVPSYDYASSALLCVEDNSCILGFDDGDGDNDEDEEHTRGCVSQQKRCDFYGDFPTGFPPQSDECLAFLVERETAHMPREDYAERLRSGSLDLSIRRDAIDWILKVHAHYNLGPLSAYLSVNYLDRFLSTYELPEGKGWMTQLLSVACLSLAAKMEETDVPLCLDLQVGEAKYVFEARTIRRMELLVLSTLKWRMQAVTPFSFIDFFLNKFSGGSVPTKAAICRSMELILSTIRGSDLLEFRPSETAAAITVLVLEQTQTMDVEKAVSGCIQVSKDQVLRCYQVIIDMELRRNRELKNDSPIGVLDAACLSYKSDERTAESHATCHHSSASKRMKISRP
ncbi:unnamed protein product, partial [Musa acuminata subsp. burmannicoides]